MKREFASTLKGMMLYTLEEFEWWATRQNTDSEFDVGVRTGIMRGYANVLAPIIGFDLCGGEEPTGKAIEQARRAIELNVKN